MTAVGNKLMSTVRFPSPQFSKKDKSQIKGGTCFATDKHSGAPVGWGTGSRSPGGLLGRAFWRECILAWEKGEWMP